MTNKNLEQLAIEFLNYKRSNGYIYLGGEYHLKRYVAFSGSISPDEILPYKKTVETFMDRYISAPGSLYNAVSVIREFGRYLYDRGYPNIYVIPSKKVSLPTPVQPYFFTAKEIYAFFKECDSVTEDTHYKGRHLVIPAIYRLLYCCGLRCKEVRTLKCKHVHIDERYIDIMQSKGPKSRRVFISEELADYLEHYDHAINMFFPERQTFFPNKKDLPYSAQMLEDNFHKFWYRAFPGMKESGIRIRPFDFRHHFAYANMNRWLRDRKDVNTMLPYLMKYMGHSDIENTLYYFHLVPDIYDAIINKSLSLEFLIPEVECNDEKE